MKTDPLQLCFLGPAGSFTHQAALEASEHIQSLYGVNRVELVACDGMPAIMSAVQTGRAWGVLAWENNVEGYVVPNLDALIDADNAVGVARIGIDVQFDAFVPKQYCGELREVSAHPHGLAQCAGFIRSHNLTPVPAASNATACRDVSDGQVALGPSICGQLYDLDTLESQVQDYRGAHTDFLVLAPRDDAPGLLSVSRSRDVEEYETVITFIPLSTGPGVLANLLDVLRDAGMNMTSFISRPIKGHDGTYSFIATIDAAPWQPRLKAVLEEVIEHGDWVKTLAVYPRRERPNPPVDDWMLPQGGVHMVPQSADDTQWKHAQLPRRELLWS